MDYPPTRAGRDHEQASRRLDVLLAFGVLVACSKDSGRQGIVAPNAPRPDGSIAASRSGGDDNDDADEDARIARRDDCDPRDPGWAPTGGCLLKRGDVSFAEFGAELSSPLSLSVVGHQAWRMDPSYLETVGAAVRVRNEGGRTHTFTRVAQFGRRKGSKSRTQQGPHYRTGVSSVGRHSSWRQHESADPRAGQLPLSMLHSPVDASADQGEATRRAR